MFERRICLSTASSKILCLLMVVIWFISAMLPIFIFEISFFIFFTYSKSDVNCSTFSEGRLHISLYLLDNFLISAEYREFKQSYISLPRSTAELGYFFPYYSIFPYISIFIFIKGFISRDLQKVNNKIEKYLTKKSKYYILCVEFF